MRKSVSLCALMLFVACAGSHAQTGARRSGQLGRRWWIGITEGERQGFLNGYSDCEASGWGISESELSSRITAYYSSHRTSTIGALQLARKISRSVPPPPNLPGAEVYTNRHAYFDGLWWKGVPDDEDLGYVEGYLVCLRHPVTKPAAQRLADAITAWYRQHPDKEDRAIAYVLEDILKAEKDSGHRREQPSHAGARQ